VTQSRRSREPYLGCHPLFADHWLRSGVGNIFTIMGRTNCEIPLAGHQKLLNLSENSTFVFLTKKGREDYEEGERLLLTYCRSSVWSWRSSVLTRC